MSDAVVDVPKTLKQREDEKSRIELDNKLREMYGDESYRTAGGTMDYMNNLRNSLNNNTAKADIYNQESGRERGISNAKAGLSGVDTSAGNEQARRNSIYGASALNEASKRSANEAYGKSVGSIISGKNKVEQQGIANKLASMGTPVAQQQGSGILSDLLGWLI